MPHAPTPKPRVLSLVLTLAPVFAGLAACNSTDEPAEPTEEQKLGVYFENALRWYTMGDIDRTQDQCERALEIDPRNERFLLLLGQVLLRRDRTEDILRAEEVFRDHPNQKDYRVKLGLAQALERKGVLYDEASIAIRSGDRFTEAADPEVRADELRAEAVAGWEEAYGEYQASLDLFSGTAGATSGLTRVTALLGRYEESIAYSNELIDTVRTSSRLIRSNLEQPDIRAIDEDRWRNAIRMNTGTEVKARLNIASLEMMLERPARAIDQYNEISHIDPEYPVAYSRRGFLYYQVGEYVKAIESIQRYLELTAAELPFEHPDVQEAYRIQTDCRAALARKSK